MHTILTKILENNSLLDRKKVKRAVLVYAQKLFYIGDTCFMLDNIKPCNSFFANAKIDLSFTPDDKNLAGLQALIKNNPYANSVTISEWEELPLEEYDVVFCAMSDEAKFLSVVEQKYGALLAEGKMHTAFFSLSKNFIYPVDRGIAVFPDYPELVSFLKEGKEEIVHELYISAEEKDWANQWYEAQGVKNEEELYIVFDSASMRSKVLRIDTYFRTLHWLLSGEKARVLMICENIAEKKALYTECLGEKIVSKIIFANRQGLRKDIVLMSADCVKMIFGPCTGLLHCASGIYNYFTANGMPAHKVPLIITYTGRYPHAVENAYFWWGNSPLVNCLLMKNLSGKPQLCVLNELDEHEKRETGNVLECKDYSAEMLTDFIGKRLHAAYAY